MMTWYTKVDEHTVIVTADNVEMAVQRVCYFVFQGFEKHSKQQHPHFFPPLIFFQFLWNFYFRA